MAAATNFIDIATIWLHAGKGGDGAVSFHREKFVAAGGPDGGDGGKGGDIIFVVDHDLSTLMDFRYKRKYTAPEGGKGGARLCHGANAENLMIKVPLVLLSRIRLRAGHCRPVRPHAGHCGKGRPGRLRQCAFCQPHPSGAQICKAGYARRTNPCR